MKVTITEIQNPSDALAALGLTRWLADLNIDSDIAGVPLEISRKMLSGDLGGGTPAPAAVESPAKRTYKKRKTAVAGSKKTAAAIVDRGTRRPKAASREGLGPAPKVDRAVESPRMSGPAPREDAPRVSIRQRIIDLLGQGPRRVSQIRTEPGMGAVDVSQHLYLMKKAGIVALNDETGEYVLVAA